MDHTYCATEKGSLTAKFSFTDVDGNEVVGTYQNSNICDILDGLGYGYLYNEMLHLVKNPLKGEFNGIIDTSKPVCITIIPSEALK